ncbi:MAG: hypothetical protein ABJ251_08850 [Paracoccaceae bacterium]
MAVLAGIVAAAAGVVTLFDIQERVSELLFGSSNKIMGAHICTFEDCGPENRRLIEVLEKNLNRSVELDILIDIPFGAGALQSRCMDDFVRADPQLGARTLEVRVIPSFGNCAPEG